MLIFHIFLMHVYWTTKYLQSVKCIASFSPSFFVCSSTICLIFEFLKVDEKGLMKKNDSVSILLRATVYVYIYIYIYLIIIIIDNCWFIIHLNWFDWWIIHAEKNNNRNGIEFVWTRIGYNRHALYTSCADLV